MSKFYQLVFGMRPRCVLRLQGLFVREDQRGVKALESSHQRSVDLLRSENLVREISDNDGNDLRLCMLDHYD